MRGREGEEGVILLNVLMFVAIAAAIVMLMIELEAPSLDRALRQREAARAMAAADGGVLSAVTALRRDMAEHPEADYPGEGWGGLAARAAPIDGGSFDLAIADATGRFNVNNMMGADAAATLLARRFAAAGAVPPELLDQAIELIRRYGPVTDLTLLRRAGLDVQALARLEPLVTALPYTTAINLNAVEEPLLAELLQDGGAAHRLVERRRQAGRLTREDFQAEGIAPPAGSGFTSDLYWVRARARIGDTVQQETALLARRRAADGSPVVQVVGRWIGPRPPAQAPALP